MRRRSTAGLRALAAFVLVLGAALLAASGARAQAADSAKPATTADGGIAVAAFEPVPAGAADVPDVAALLADRLSALGVGRVVGPAALAAPAQLDPAADALRGWAERAQVGAIVTGRTTRKGAALTLDVRLRAPSGGAPVGSYVAQVARPEELAAAVATLADQIVQQGLPAMARGDVAAPAPAGPPPSAGSQADGSPLPLDVGGLKKDAPLSIQSDELEAVQGQQGRRFLFTGNVRVKQDTMRLKSDRLEAFYPPQGNEPERLVATGRVVVTQKDQEAHCDSATYLQAKQRIFCRGNAELRQGQDRVRGQEIEIRLDTEQLIVRGGAEVHIQPKSDSADAEGDAGRQG